MGPGASPGLIDNNGMRVAVAIGIMPFNGKKS